MNAARRIGIVLATALVCVLPFAWFGAKMAQHDVWSATGPTMGTAYTLTVVAEWGWPWPEDVQPAVDKRLAVVNQWMSTYDPASELSRFNKHMGDDWFTVSPQTARVVAHALDVAVDSGGAYDPTVAPIVDLWGFGPGGRRDAPPTDAKIVAVMEDVGYELVEARLDPPALRKTREGVTLDLSSIAKGFGVDEVSRVVADSGVDGSMVEIGGEVVCRGVKPGGLPWRIGVLSPEEGEQLVLELRDEAVATSGDYLNFFEHEGVRYSHTIDPQTGRPVTHDTTAVTVRAADCMTADALATALLVMGADAGYDWAEGRGVAAMFISRISDGFQQTTTPAWDAALKASKK